MSPDYLATKKAIKERRPSGATTGASLIRAAGRQLTDRARLPAMELDDDAGIELEINRLYRTRLAAVRHMPRRERIHAVRAARQWRSWALLAIREKRDRERRARHVERRTLMPEPT